MTTLPKNRPPTHPGEMFLEEFLVPLGLSQSELAGHSGVVPAYQRARLPRLKHKLLFTPNALKQHHIGLEEADDGI